MQCATRAEPAPCRCASAAAAAVAAAPFVSVLLRLHCVGEAGAHACAALLLAHSSNAHVRRFAPPPPPAGEAGSHAPGGHPAAARLHARLLHRQPAVRQGQGHRRWVLYVPAAVSFFLAPCQTIAGGAVRACCCFVLPCALPGHCNWVLYACRSSKRLAPCMGRQACSCAVHPHS